MNIVMFTNTFSPHVGGVARSVEQFASQYRERGHRVLIVAPLFEGCDAEEGDVIRIPAIQHFNGTDFSVPMPVPGLLSEVLEQFQPTIVHTHHPFLLGDTALRTSAQYDIPIVFTHHTQYERYTHYVPGDSELMKRFVVDLAVGYCNLCDAVIAPSETIRSRLIGQGVTTEVFEIPTGVDLRIFGRGNGKRWRARNAISDETFLVGHVGRLAPEKGLDFLAPVVASFIESTAGARFVVAGDGPSLPVLLEAFRECGVSDRLLHVGTLDRAELADLYAAFDVFVFASFSETQGMVLTEAMAGGTPVIAIDAPGVREVMRDGENGRMLVAADAARYLQALQQFAQLPLEQRERYRTAARQTAADFSLPRTANDALSLYARLIARGRSGDVHGQDAWSTAQRLLAEEWKIWSNVASAAATAILPSANQQDRTTPDRSSLGESDEATPPT